MAKNYKGLLTIAPHRHGRGRASGAGVLWQLVRQLVGQAPPEPVTMGVIAVVALIANLGCAVLLVRFRHGDSNLRSAWLCSRNDVLANVAIILAAGGVFASATVWPDLLVGLGIAALNLPAACSVIRQATTELMQE